MGQQETKARVKSLVEGTCVLTVIIWCTSGLFYTGFGYGLFAGDWKDALRFALFFACILGIWALRCVLFVTIVPRFYPSHSILNFLRDACSAAGCLLFAGQLTLLTCARFLSSSQTPSSCEFYSVMCIGTVSAFLYIHKQEYLLQFPIIHESSPAYRCIESIGPSFIRAFRRSVVSCLLAYIIVYMTLGQILSVFEFIVHFMLHFYLIMANIVMHTYLTCMKQPLNQLDLEETLKDISVYESGSFENQFLHFSKLHPSELDRGTSPFRQPAAVLSRRYEQVVNVVRNLDETQVIREFSNTNRSVAKELDRCMAFLNLGVAIQFDKKQSFALINDKTAWTDIFLRCTAMTDALTLKLELVADSIRHHTRIRQRSVLLFLRQFLHMNLCRVNPIVVHFLYHRKKAQKYEPFLFDLQRKTNHVAIVGNTQVLRWSIDILAMLVCDSRENNRQGHVQVSVFTLLHRLHII